MTRTPAKRLSEVAQKVGVSEATVSRVLNGKAGVSDSTRESVLTALDVLGYERPTRLRGQRARLIGLVLPELQNPIFPALAEVIGGALAQRGFTPVLCTRTTGGLSEADYVDMLLEQHASGVVFAGGHFAEQAAPHEHYELLREKGIPVLLVNAAIEGLDFPCVSTDDISASQQAFGHLLALGHERIGLVLGPMITCRRGGRWLPSAPMPSAVACRSRRSSMRCSRWRAARRPPRASCGRGLPGSSAAATSWRSALSGRFAAPA